MAAEAGSASAPPLWRRALSQAAQALAGRVQHALFPRQLPTQEQTAGIGAGGEEHPAWADELQRVTGRGYRALLSAPWYLNLGSFAGDDWLTYWQVEPLSFDAPPKQAGRAVGAWCTLPELRELWLLSRCTGGPGLCLFLFSKARPAHCLAANFWCRPHCWWEERRACGASTLTPPTPSPRPGPTQPQWPSACGQMHPSGAAACTARCKQGALAGGSQEH